MEKNNVRAIAFRAMAVLFIVLSIAICSLSASASEYTTASEVCECCADHSADQNEPSIRRRATKFGPIQMDEAKAEELLNIIVNITEFSLVCQGTLMIVGVFGLESWKIEENSWLKLFLGGLMIMGGLALPGIVNWLYASSRDCGGFS